ncbi:MAG: pilus assembly protein [Anaerolineaceae bacterium]|nr:pilus assembly protein [Anaerolineaceae bacterium]
MQKFRRKQPEHGQGMVEAAIVLPLLIAVFMVIVQFSLAGVAGNAAATAANLGARAGSVAQRGEIGAAISAANSSLADMPGDYTVSASGGGGRGSQITVFVNWTVPDILIPMNLHGTQIATFRQEGW